MLEKSGDWDYAQIYNGRVEDPVHTSIRISAGLDAQIGKLLAEGRNPGFESQSAFWRNAALHYIHAWTDRLKDPTYARLSGIAEAEVKRKHRQWLHERVDEHLKFYQHALDAAWKERDLVELDSLISEADASLPALSEVPRVQSALHDEIIKHKALLESAIG